MRGIRWRVVAILAIPGMVPVLMLHNYVMYEMSPAETVKDILFAMKA